MLELPPLQAPSRVNLQNVAIAQRKAVFLKETLKKIDDSKFTMVSAVEFKDPTTLLLVSIFLGALGIDHFMLGDTGMGILRKH